MEPAYILYGTRTPIGKFQGGLSPLKATDLGAHVVKACVAALKLDPAAVDEAIFGNVISAGLGQNPARQAALQGGLPPTIPAFTVNKVCGSGLKAVSLAAQAVAAGEADLAVAGGMESMTNAPYLAPEMRAGSRLGDARLLDAMIVDGLWCPFEDWHMGKAADHTAQKHKLTRERQDLYAIQSHQRAAKAAADGLFAQEITPVPLKSRKGDLTLSADEGIRADASPEGMAKLKPAFDPAGTVTAANASQISDGAAALVVASEAGAKKAGVKPVARILATAVSGVPPKEIFDAPVGAIRKLLEKAQLKPGQIDLFEVNEAFAAQTLANSQELGLDAERVNIHGGAIALGHPIGCSGARILVTLLNALTLRQKRYGIAAACLGGGNAIALAVERV